MLADDALPVQTGIFKIEEQSKLQPSDVQVANHLGHVCFIESANHFGVYDHGIIDDEVRDETSYSFSPVEHRI